MQSLVFSVSADTLGDCDPFTLRRQIGDDQNIAAECHAVTVSGDVIQVLLLSQPTQADLDSIEQIVSVQNGPDDLALRIGDYLPAPAVIFDPPKDLDYTRNLSIRLKKKETFEKGELQKIEYFASGSKQADGSWLFEGGPVVRETFVYTRDAALFAESRTQTIAWLRKDGTEHPDRKTREKVYARAASIKEGKRRRGNVIDDLELVVAGLLLETELANQAGDIQATLKLGRDLVAVHGDAIRDFVNVSSQQIVADIAADAQFAWLDNQPASLGGAVSIRAAILSTLDIWS